MPSGVVDNELDCCTKQSHQPEHVQVDLTLDDLECEGESDCNNIGANIDVVFPDGIGGGEDPQIPENIETLIFSDDESSITSQQSGNAEQFNFHHEGIMLNNLREVNGSMKSNDQGIRQDKHPLDDSMKSAIAELKKMSPRYASISDEELYAELNRSRAGTSCEIGDNQQTRWYEDVEEFEPFDD